MNLVDLVQWWNLPFVLPFGLALTLLLLQTFGAFAGDHGADGHSADAHLHHDVGHAHGLHEAHAADAPAGFLERALGLLGIGRAPLGIVLMTLCFVWGFTGFAANTLLAPVLHTPALYFWISTIIAGAAALGVTGSIARLVGRLMPSTESQATREADLVGYEGTALYDVSSTFGRVRLHDQYGNLLEVTVHVNPGAPPILANTPVVLTHYDAEQRSFLAVPGTAIEHLTDQNQNRSKERITQ